VQQIKCGTKLNIITKQCNKKYISKRLYYTQIMINILVIFFAQYKFQEKQMM